jgi:hypothetical protein
MMMPPPEVLDADSNGSITLKEYFAAMDIINQERFTQMDKNADGLVSQDELASQRPGPPPGEGRGQGRGQGRHTRPDGDFQGPPPPPPDGDKNLPGGPRGPMPPRSETFDANKDGSVTFEEFCAAWDKFNQEHFNRFDVNQDASLSQDELAKMQRPGPPPGGGRGRRGDAGMDETRL